MEEHDIEKALNIGIEMISKVLGAEYPLEDFIISKTLRGYYKNPDTIAHAVLARRIGQRNLGAKPQSNDRIPYCFIRVPEKKGEKILQGNRIELPEFIIENDLKIDYPYYVVKQLMKPIVQIFDLTEYDAQKLMFDDPLREYDYKIRGIRKITDFFSKKPANEPKIYSKLSDLGKKFKQESEDNEKRENSDGSDRSDDEDTTATENESEDEGDLDDVEIDLFADE